MSKIIVKEDIKVEVIPSDWLLDNRCREKYESQLIDVANEIAKSIRRHIDNLDNVVVSYSRKEICGFCKIDWEIDDEGCPVCCDKALEEWEKDNENSGTS